MASRSVALLSQAEGLLEEFLSSPEGDTELGAQVERSLNEAIKPALEELRNGGDESSLDMEESQPPQHKNFDMARRQAKSDIEASKAEPPSDDEEGEEQVTTKKKFGPRR